MIEKCKSAATLKQDDANLPLKYLNQEKAFTKNEVPPLLSASTPNELNKINFQEKPAKRKLSCNETVEFFRCGYTGHRAIETNCPAIGKTCNKYGSRNYFSPKCKLKHRMQTNLNYNVNR